MRHSTINLTMNVYTDPKLLDVAGAVESLPMLPLENGPQATAGVVKATGTDDIAASQFAPKFAPTSGKLGVLQSILDNPAPVTGELPSDGEIDESACAVNRKEPLSTRDNDSLKWAMRDSNPRHPRCKRGALAD